MNACRAGLLFSALAVAAFGCGAQAAADLQNWFGDPFFQISSAIDRCPVPLGPFTTEAERRVESHHRAEKGTTCWLSGHCDRPNDYAYDQDIASAFRSAIAEAGRGDIFKSTTLWVTVQGRVVYIEGCVSREADTPRLESFSRTLPYVQQAIAIVRIDATARAPYRIRPSE